MMIYGPEYTTVAPERERCGNCQKPADDLVVLGSGWNFNACPACAEWCYAVEMAEPCPNLHRAVINANSIEAVRLALRAHQSPECAHCGSTRKTVVEDRSVLGTQDATCCKTTPKAAEEVA